MQAPRAAEPQTRIADRALIAFELIVLAMGVLQFAFASASIERPLLAIGTLAALASLTVLLRLAPLVRARNSVQYGLDISVMCVAITLLAFASGAARSALTALYLLPIAAAAMAFGRFWIVLVVAAVVGGLSFMLGMLTAELEVGSAEFGVVLVTTLVPGTAVALLLASLVERMQNAARTIRDLAATDALTGLMNFRAFESVLQQEHRKAERFGREYSLVTVDVDNLAQINEALGHEAGSLILNTVASAITRSVRNSDIVARLGGDEFIVLCVESAPEISAAIAQRIRNNVYAGTVSVANRLIRANVSVGVANFPEDHLYPKELMILAGQRMQQDRDLRRAPAST
jgi:diguanylate cyclase (GGDEF)-like protein